MKKQIFTKGKIKIGILFFAILLMVAGFSYLQNIYSIQAQQLPALMPYPYSLPLGVSLNDDTASWDNGTGYSGNAACALLSMACERAVPFGYYDPGSDNYQRTQTCSDVSVGGQAYCTTDWRNSDVNPIPIGMYQSVEIKGVSWNGTFANAYYACQNQPITPTPINSLPQGLYVIDDMKTLSWREDVMYTGNTACSYISRDCQSAEPFGYNDPGSGNYQQAQTCSDESLGGIAYCADYATTTPMWHAVAWDENGRALSLFEGWGITRSPGHIRIEDFRTRSLRNGTALCIKTVGFPPIDIGVKVATTTIPWPKLCRDYRALNYLRPLPCLYEPPKQPCPVGQYRDENGECVDIPIPPPPPRQWPPLVPVPKPDSDAVEWAPPGVFVEIDSDKYNFCASEEFNLTWDSQRANSCTASMASGVDSSWSVASTSGTKSMGPIPAGSYTYKITCNGTDDGTPQGNPVSASSSVMITTQTQFKEQVSMQSNPSSITKIGSTSTISWSLQDPGGDCVDRINVFSCYGSISGPSGFVDNDFNGKQISDFPNNPPYVTPILNRNGNYYYSLNCKTESGADFPASTVINVNIPPPTISIEGIPSYTNPQGEKVTSITEEGTSATLEWKVENATSCTATSSGNIYFKIDEQWLASSPNATNGTHTAPTENYYENGVYGYGLTCTGPGGTTTSNIWKVVVAIPPKITSFFPTPSTINILDDDSLKLTLNFMYADFCDVYEGITGFYSSSESSPFVLFPGLLNEASLDSYNMNGDYVYNAYCYGIGGMTEASTTVLVRVPPSFEFTTDNTNLSFGDGSDTATMSWSDFKNAGSCTISNNIGPTGQSVDIPPTDGNTTSFVCDDTTVGQAFTYTLSCSGTGGYAGPNVSTSTEISCSSSGSGYSVSSISSSLSASPSSTITAGNPVTITWGTSGAVAGSGVASGGNSTWPGALNTNDGPHTWTSPPLSAGTYTYTISYKRSSGETDTSSVTVNVASGPTLTFEANPTSVNSGNSTTLVWNSENTSSCSASGAWSGAKGTSGSEITGPITSNKIYTLTCVGDGSSTSSSANVSVLSAVQVQTSSAKAISSFKIGDSSGFINNLYQTILVTVPMGTDVKNLVPIIVIPAGATISPASGVPQDFTKVVIYTVTAQNGSKASYQVGVKQ
jgi:hypothetical protein